MILRRLASLSLVSLLAASGVAAKDLVILHTNDLHGYIFPRPFQGEQLPPSQLGRPLGGVFSAATYAQRARRAAARKGDRVLFLDAGDQFGGNYYDALSEGRAVAEAYADKALTVDAIVPGNHAEDYGEAPWVRFLDQVTPRVPVLCANCEQPRDRDPMPGYRIFELDGLKVGVIGLLKRGGFRNLEPRWKAGDELDALKRVLPAVRKQADYVILLTHIGYGRARYKLDKVEALDDRDPAGNIDLIVDGHSHRDEEIWADDDTFVVQADHYGVRIGEVRVKVGGSRKKGFTFGKPRAKRVVLDAKKYPPHAGMRARLRKHLKARAKAEDVLVVDTEPGVQVPHLLRNDSSTLVSKMGDLVCAAYLHAAREEGLRVDLAAAFHRSVRTGLYALDEPGFTAGDLHASSPFGEPVTVVEATGRELREKLFEQGKITKTRMSFGQAHAVVRQKSRDPDDRELVKVTISGKPLKDGKTYRLVADGWLSGWFKGKRFRKELSVIPKQALEALLDAEAKSGRLSQGDIDRLAPASQTLLD